VSDISFRRGEKKDAVTIAEFQIAMAWETEKLKLDPTTCGKGVSAVFEDSTRGHYYVACEGERLVGSLFVCFEWSDWRNGVVWWIHSVYLEPSVRGRGVFSEFYAMLKKEAQGDPGVRGLRLYVEKSNHHAQKVYAALGMTKEHYDLFEWLKGT
jgi:RimJ/RimL family protein N-acetyltransferase